MANNLSSLDANLVLRAAYDDDSGSLGTNNVADLVKEAYDYVALTYVAAGQGAGEIETVIYKIGGAGGTTVATLTLAYDVNDKLSTVTRS